jgi:hypothetical protein
MINQYSKMKKDMHKHGLEVVLSNKEDKDNYTRNKNNNNNYDNIVNLNRWCRDIRNKLERKNNNSNIVRVKINQIRNRKIYKAIKLQNNLQSRVKRVRMFLMWVKQANIVAIINKVKKNKNQIKDMVKVI